MRTTTRKLTPPDALPGPPPFPGSSTLPGKSPLSDAPDWFNRAVADFVAQVEAGRWEARDPRANAAQIMKTD